MSASQSVVLYVGGVAGNGTSGYSCCSGNIVGYTGAGGSGGASGLSGYGGGRGGDGGPSNWSGGGGGGGAASVVTVDGQVSAVGAGGGGGGGGGSNDSLSIARNFNGTTGSLVGSGTTGGAGARPGGDGGGGGGGGAGHLLGGRGGIAPGGETEGYGGSAGSNFLIAGATVALNDTVAPQGGSIYVEYYVPPTVSTYPTVPASPGVGASVTGSAGTWVGANSYAYQWLRCDQAASATSQNGSLSVPSGCEAIDGATALTYAPTVDDLGQYLRLAVTATNSGGSTSALSATASSATSLGAPTVDLVAASDLGKFSTDNLTSDTTPTYSIAGLGVGSSYTVTAAKGADTVTLGPFVAAATTKQRTFPELADGTWSVSAVQEFSDANATTFTSPSSNTVSMVIDTSPPVAPAGLALNPASDTGASSSDSITNDTTPTIDLTGLEVGNKVVVTASKPGSADVTCVIVNVTSATESCTFTSALTSDGEWTFSAVQVDDAGNESAVSPAITATLDTSAGVALSSVPLPTGSSATAATSFLFAATLTDPPAGATDFTASDISIAGTSTGWSVDPASWAQISPTEYTFVVSATTPTQGTLVVKVPAGSYDDTAGNSATATAGPDWTSTVVVESPVSTAAPVVTALTGSTTTLGSTLSSTAGTWNDKGDLGPVTSYQWQICDDAVGTNCVDVSGATGSTYVPAWAAEGKYVRSVVTRTNVKGETEQASNIVGPTTKSPQDIDFANPGTKTYSPTPFTVAPRSEFPGGANLTGLTVQMASLTPDVCIVSGLSVTMLKAGTCTLAADQPGSAEFDPATRVTQSFTINRASDSSTTTPSATQVEPGDTFTLSTSNLTSGDDTYTIVSGPCTVIGNVVTATGTGNCVIGTTSAEDDRYAASSAPNVTVAVRDTDSIALPVLDDTLVSAGAFTVGSLAVSGRAPTLTAGPGGVCSFSGGQVVPIGPGTCTVTGSLPDNGSWSSASASVSFDLVAPPAAPLINSVKTAAADGVLGGTAQVYFTPGALNGSVLVGYDVMATPVGGGSPVTISCSLSPCTIAGLSAADYDITVTTSALAVGADVEVASPAVRATALAPHPIAFLSPGSVLAGSRPVVVTPVSLVDDSWIPTVTSSTPSVCQVSGMTVSILSVGTCTLTAQHTGGSIAGTNYGLGSQTMSFGVVSPAPPPTVAGAPLNVGASIVGDNVIVTWSPPASAGSFPVTSYQVMTSTGQTCLSPTPSCTFPAPAPGQGVTFIVRALTGAGWGPWSAPITVGVGPSDPSEPADPSDPTEPADPSDPSNPTDPSDPSEPGRTGLKSPPPPTTVTIDRDGQGKATVTIELPATRSDRPIEFVVIAIIGPDGEVLRRVTVDVGPDDRTVTERITLPEGATIRVYTTNRAGVSNRAPAGANLVPGDNVIGKRPDGRPILYGKKIAKPVFFSPDSPELDARALKVLDKVAGYVGKHGGTVFITGFVFKDPGPKSFDKKLSSDRAEQVARYLSSLGVDTWIHFDGAGHYRQTDPRDSDRRVEIRWSKDAIPG